MRASRSFVDANCVERVKESMPDDEARRALRQKLRQKIRDGRTPNAGPSQAARNIARDPTTAMLQMGIDDPAMLAMADKIAADPQGVLRTLKSAVRDATEEEGEAPPPLPSVAPADDEDDEAPPPPA